MVSLKICSALLLVVACATAASTNDLKHDNNPSVPITTSANIEPSSQSSGHITSPISLKNVTILPEPTSTSLPTTSKPNSTTTTKPNPTTTEPNSTTTTTTTKPNPTTTTEPNSTTTSTTTTKPNPTTTTEPNSTTTSTTTSKPSSTTSTTTVAPSPEPNPDRRFDGPSFFGGLALGFSIMGIAYAAYRFFYFNRGGAYHTL